MKFKQFLLEMPIMPRHKKEFEKIGKEYGAVIYDASSFIQVVAYIALLIESNTYKLYRKKNNRL